MRRFLPTLAFLVLNLTVYAQLGKGGHPIAFTNTELPTPPVLTMETFDAGAMLREDEQNTNKIGPFRFGRNFETNLNLHNSGEWTKLQSGGRIWQLKIKSTGAYSINLAFDDFFIPEGGSLYIYSANREVILGGFSHLNNSSDRMFATDLIKGDEIILEYFEPHEIFGQSHLQVSRVTHAYRDLFNLNQRSFGSSGSCNINPPCPLGANWEDQIRAVVMLVSGGNGFCTGTLLNNTAEDGKPYLLTASHCGSSGFGAWVFRFNWLSPTCPNPASSPNFQSLTGAAERARNANSDFLLLELNDQVPSGYNPYFAGWDNQNNAANSAVCIHHPSGDIKKISQSSNTVVSQTWEGADTWMVPQWSEGTTEPGSSGSPLFNPDKLVIGQLYGGSASCSSQLEDFYGKFSTSWNGASASTRLRDWLDPLNTNATTLQGFDPNITSFLVDAGISGILVPFNNESFCRDSIKPRVVLRNFGQTPLNSITINYQINTQAIQTFSWIGNLNTGSTETINLPAIAIPLGNLSFTVFTSNPNGTTDENTANDTKLINFTNETPTNVKEISPPFVEDFESQTFPSNGWSIENPDNSNTWKKANTGGFGASSKSIFLDNFNYSSIGQSDFLLTPYLDFSTAITPARLEFDLAYARFDMQLHDSLAISVSTDCGGEWNRIYSKGNLSLSTVGNNNISNAFIPNPNQWRRESIDLDAFLGEPFIKFRFENINGNGNNLYIDNISVFDGTVGLEGYPKVTGFKLYPNPASNYLNVAVPGDAVSLVVYDIFGRKEMEATLKDMRNLQLDVSNLSPGVHLVEVVSLNKKVFGKFVKL